MLELLDSASRNGTDYGEFEKLLKEIDSNTFCEPVKLKDCSLLSYLEKEENSVICALSPKGMRVKFDRKVMLLRGGPELLAEMEDHTKLMIRHGASTYYTSMNMISTFKQRVRLGGDAILTPSFFRDRYMAQLMEIYQPRANLVIRNSVKGENQIGKVFAVMGGDYKYIPQQSLLDLIEMLRHSLGKLNCRAWNVDNTFSEIYVEFPDKADEIRTLYGFSDDFVPGLYLATSDVGESSLIVRESWRLGGSIVTGREEKTRHDKRFNLEEMFCNIKNSIYEQYTELPERLADLLVIPVMDLDKTVQSLMEQTGIQKAIGKRNSNQLEKAIVQELDPALPHNAYDVAVSFMTLGQRCTGMAQSSVNAIERLAMKAAFANYSIPAPAITLAMPA